MEEEEGILRSCNGSMILASSERHWSVNGCSVNDVYPNQSYTSYSSIDAGELAQAIVMMAVCFNQATTSCDRMALDTNTDRPGHQYDRQPASSLVHRQEWLLQKARQSLQQSSRQHVTVKLGLVHHQQR